MEAASAQGFAAVAFSEAGTFKMNHFSHKDIGLGDLHWDSEDGRSVSAAHHPALTSTRRFTRVRGERFVGRVLDLARSSRA